MTSTEANTMKTRELLRMNRHANGTECPECGNLKGIEDNGCKGRALSFCCAHPDDGGEHGGCGAQWDAIDYRLTDAEAEDLRDAVQGADAIGEDF
jgi:hypothetical protein